VTPSGLACRGLYTWGGWSKGGEAWAYHGPFVGRGNAFNSRILPYGQTKPMEAPRHGAGYASLTGGTQT